MLQKKPIIAANWKMHKTGCEVEDFFNTALPSLKNTPAHIWIAPSATALRLAAQKAHGSNVVIGAQNIYFESQGAFTGEVSASQVFDAGARFVIIGHSERRDLFGETNVQIEKKIKLATQYQLRPLLCVGETLQERKEHQTAAVLKIQLIEALQKDPGFDGVIAYEPRWAIGTGQSATPEMIEETHAMCRDILSNLCVKGRDIPILYGGSVTPQTAPVLKKIKNVDGALVGGASLEAQSFISIAQGYCS
jgi:triosephosphate isomerase (TIM)